MVLMVVVVVAVGGVFARLFAYHGEPRLPSGLVEKFVEKSVEKFA